METEPKIGLVLVGGGAKGAYQAGAIKYLSEKLKFVPNIIAGTSIGALNGAILASHKSFPEAVKRLNDIWDTKIDKRKILDIDPWFPIKTAVIKPEFIENLLRENVQANALRNGIELWVTVFPSIKINVLGIGGSAIQALGNFVIASAGKKPHWHSVKNIANEQDLYNLILASAAIPVAFPTRTVEGQLYCDGFLGDNIPVKPLAVRGCKYVIVIHLCDKEIFDSSKFPDTAIIEIRPTKPTTKSGSGIIGSLSSMLDFSHKRIEELKECGEKDAQYFTEYIFDKLEIWKKWHESHEKMLASAERFQQLSKLKLINIQNVLIAHNQNREIRNLPSIKWSFQLAESAQEWANHLALNNSFQHSSTQNIEIIWVGATGTHSKSKMIEFWGSQQKICSDNISINGSWQDICTQANEVGCALATNGANDYLVCQYGVDIA
ncbi:MAG: patatin-like phospholipase family protein [Nostoc indistinguendum CM1-VF10]|jgi:NTE family protein|nr:patatin-like phospholipase family protein [Nostoc indistinguendum CM1-VF10]